MASSEFKKAATVIQRTVDRFGYRSAYLLFSVFISRAIAILLLLQMTIPTWARTKKEPASPTDPGYVLALATANRFLLAWQTGDLANGMVLLSDGIRHSQNADKLEEFFSAESDRGFEIGAGRGSRLRYSFPVVLVTAKANRLSRRPSFIVLVLSGKNDWVVDKLP